MRHCYTHVGIMFLKNVVTQSQTAVDITGDRSPTNTTGLGLVLLWSYLIKIYCYCEEAELCVVYAFLFLSPDSVSECPLQLLIFCRR